MTDDVAGPGNGPLPIREVPLTAPLRWLALGWHDFTRAFGPSLFHGFFSRPAKSMVSAGRIAKLFDEVGQHGLQYSWIHGSGGMVIEENGKLHRSTPCAEGD